MSKRWFGALAGVLLVAGGCNDVASEPTVTADEQEAIRQLHNVPARKPGAEDAITYLLWEGATVTDGTGNPVRVVRVKVRLGTRTDTSDVLYLFDKGKPVRNRLNGSGDHWHEDAAVWAKGKQ